MLQSSDHEYIDFNEVLVKTDLNQALVNTLEVGLHWKGPHPMGMMQSLALS